MVGSSSPLYYIHGTRYLKWIVQMTLLKIPSSFTPQKMAWPKLILPLTVTPSGFPLTRWLSCSNVTNPQFPVTSKTFLQRVSLNEIQLLQNLQQLPQTERPIRSNSTILTSLFLLVIVSNPNEAHSSVSGQLASWRNICARDLRWMTNAWKIWAAVDISKSC